MKLKLDLEIDQDEFFKNWDPKEIERLSDEEKQGIIEWFLNRQLTLKRDSYKCQNELCPHKINDMLIPERRNLVTVHHVIPRRDFKENPQSMIKRLGYECDDMQNLTTLCRCCHIDYEKARAELVIDGQSYKLERASSYDYKKIIKDGKALRRAFKKLHKVGWQGISEEDRLELICMLMKWLNTEWTEIIENY